MRILLLLFFIAPTAPAAINPYDQQTAQFFAKQCPGCNPVNLQFYFNQRRQLLAHAENKELTLKPGFYTANQAEIPEKVKQAGRAVYSLIVLAQDESQYPEFYTFHLAEIFKNLSNTKDTQKLRVAQVVNLYLQKCQSENKALCRAPLNSGAIGAGSGILIGASGKEIWSAGHVFEEPFRQALRALQTEDLQELVRRRHNFKVLIFDSDNRLIAHPFNNSFKLTYTASPVIIPRLDPNIQIDNIRFELGSSLGKGLEIAPIVEVGADVFSVGYPACTGCAKQYNSVQEKLISGTRFPHRDASDFDQQFTLGRILKSEDTLIITNADGHGGMSGGATLDADGRVIGINSAVGVSVTSPHFLADRRLKLSRPAVWASTLVDRRT